MCFSKRQLITRYGWPQWQAVPATVAAHGPGLLLLLLGAPATLLGPRWRPWLAAGFVLLATRLIAG